MHRSPKTRNQGFLGQVPRKARSYKLFRLRVRLRLRSTSCCCGTAPLVRPAVRLRVGGLGFGSFSITQDTEKTFKTHVTSCRNPGKTNMRHTNRAPSYTFTRSVSFLVPARSSSQASRTHAELGSSYMSWRKALSEVLGFASFRGPVLFCGDPQTDTCVTLRH